MFMHSLPAALSSLSFINSHLMMFWLIILALGATTLGQARLSGSAYVEWSRNNQTHSFNLTLPNMTLPNATRLANLTTSHNNNNTRGGHRIINATKNNLLDWIDSTSVDHPICTLQDALSGNATVLRDAVLQWLSDTVLTPLTCPAAQQGPPCAYSGQAPHSQKIEPGVWVCRTLYHPLTGARQSTTHCANPVLTLPTDTCGSCTGRYPKPCKTMCQMMMPDSNTTQAGVLVSFNKGYSPFYCMNAMAVTTMMSESPNVACAIL